MIGGNCGFSIAPLAPEHVDYVMRMMARVEGMPLDVARSGPGLGLADASASGSTGIDGRLAVNAGFLVGHSTIRRVVMGDDATTRRGDARPDRRDGRAAARVARAPARSGSRRRSARRTPTATARPVPSRAAQPDEFLALARRGARPRGHHARVHPRHGRDLRRAHRAHDRHVARRRPPAQLEPARQRVAHAGLRAAAHVVPTTPPRTAPRGRARAPRRHAPPQQPACSQSLPGLGRGRRAPRRRTPRRAWPTPRCASASAPGSTPPAHAGVAGDDAVGPGRAARRPQRRRRSPRERGTDAVDVLLDVVVPDALPLTTVFPSLVPSLGVTDESWEVRGEVWRDDRVVLGGSDAGAHVDLMCHANYPTVVLGELVRGAGLFTLEDAVHQMTDVPARLFGLRDRGRIAEGAHADLVRVRPRHRRAASPPRSATTCPAARCGCTPRRGRHRAGDRRRRDHRRAGCAHRRAARYVAPIGCRHRHRHRSRPKQPRRQMTMSDSRGVAFVTGASRGIGKADRRAPGPRRVRHRAGAPAPSTRARRASTRRRSSGPTPRRCPGSLDSTAALVEAEGRQAMSVFLDITDRTTLGSSVTHGARALGPHRRAGEQRPLHRSRPHGPHARHARRGARQAPRGQRDGADHPDQAGAAADDRARQRHHHDGHVRRRAAATRPRPPAKVAGASATACRRARSTASSAS